MPFPHLTAFTTTLLAASLLVLAPGGAHATTAAKAVKPAASKDAAALPGYQADLSQTTVSGLSSGGFMAAQFAVAYSAMWPAPASSPAARISARASRAAFPTFPT